MACKEIGQSIEGMYTLLSKAYEGNWQNRWRDTPYLRDALKEGRVEAITGHVWGAMEFWFLLRRACPNLNSLVDTTEVYEILLNHDLGETYKGDVPLFRKINGEIDDKVAERLGVEEISEQLPDTKKELVGWFDKFEGEIENVDSLEILVAKWIDNLQGNHFALTFGKELPKYSKPINKILQIRFVPYTNRLIEVLQEKGEQEAINEVKQVAKHHTELIKAAGIDFDTSGLKL